MKKSLCLFALATVAAAVNAQNTPKLSGTSDTGLSYNEVGIGYGTNSVTVSNKDYRFSGLGVGGTFLVHENIYITASHYAPTASINNVNVDLTQTSFGAGARFKMAASTDAYVEYQYIDAKVATSSASEKSTGNGFIVGLRTLLAPKVEGDIYTGYAKLKNSDSSTTVGIGLGFRAADNFIIRTSYSSSKDSNTVIVSLNYAF